MGSRVRTLLDGQYRIGHVRDVLAREIQRKLPEGGVIESSFDPTGRLVQRLVRAPSEERAIDAREPESMGRRDDGVTAGRAYAYDANGELISRTDRARGVTRYEYDPWSVSSPLQKTSTGSGRQRARRLRNSQPSDARAPCSDRALDDEPRDDGGRWRRRGQPRAPSVAHLLEERVEPFRAWRSPAREA